MEIWNIAVSPQWELNDNLVDDKSSKLRLDVDLFLWRKKNVFKDL